MTIRRTVQEFPFPNPGEENGYLLFSPEMESEELVAFHGAAESNLDSIIENNFRVSGWLSSISFAATSSLALGYGCEKRSEQSPQGVVIAAKLQSLEKPHVVHSGSIIHLYKPEEVPPSILGYCIIPESYVHS